MKLSIGNLRVHNRFGEEKGLELIKQAGFDCIDYGYMWLKQRKEEVLGDGYIEYAQHVRKLLDEYSLTCNQAHTQWSVKPDSPFDLSDENYKDVVRSIEAAAVLGAENVVVHVITPTMDQDLFELNYRYYKSLEKYAANAGTHIAVENLYLTDKKRNCYRSRLGTPAELNRMLEMLDSDVFTICADLGHAALTWGEPEDFIPRINRKAFKAIHVHDNDYFGDDHTYPYLGQFNWDNIAKALAEIDYNGDLTFEISTYDNFPDELIGDALGLAAKVGRHIIKMIETEKEKIQKN